MNSSHNRAGQLRYAKSQPGYTLQGAAERIASSPAPVLFPDTCSLVDLVRMPNPKRTDRREISDRENDLAAAQSLLKKSQNQELWIVVPPPVPREYDEHAPRAAQKVQEQWEKIDHRVRISLFAAGVIDVPSDLPSQTNFGQSLEPLLVEIKQIADNLIACGLRVESDESCQLQAITRAESRTAPAEQGKGFKDCKIVEHVLALSELLDELGTTMSRVFLTSNTNDFSEGGAKPKSPLDSQFEDVGLQLAVQWQQAQAIL